jgi:hypothetical protein
LKLNERKLAGNTEDMSARVGSADRHADDEETGCGSCIFAFCVKSRIGFKNALLDITNGSEGSLEQELTG